jgi:hypothetical protein
VALGVKKENLLAVDVKVSEEPATTVDLRPCTRTVANITHMHMLLKPASSPATCGVSVVLPKNGSAGACPDQGRH